MVLAGPRRSSAGRSLARRVPSGLLDQLRFRRPAPEGWSVHSLRPSPRKVMMKSVSLAVVITARNEERNLAPTVDAVLACLKEYFPAYEVLIIDDGSRDGTGRVAGELARKHHAIRVVHHSTSRGF